MYVQWNKDLEIGIAEIDGDHRKLVALFNDFVAAMEMGAGALVIEDTVRNLVDYTKHHFGQEEILFEDLGCPDEMLQAHKAEHIKLIREVEVFVEQMGKGETTKVSNKASRFLEGWLIKHIQGTDRVCGQAIGRPKTP